MAHPLQKLLLTGLLSCAALFCATLARVSDAASLPLRFEQLNVEQGLPQESALAILQDRKGFMWIGTVAGLARYDGYSMTVFKNRPDDPSSLSDNFITCLYQDSQGQIWVGTRGGLNRYDDVLQKFVRYMPEPGAVGDAGKTVNAILSDESEGMWLGTEGGLKHFIPRTGAFTALRHDANMPHSLTNDQVLALARAKNGDLLVGTFSGLDRMKAGSTDFEHITMDGTPESGPRGDGVKSLAISSDGNIWVGTARGVKVIKPGSAEARALPGKQFEDIDHISVSRLHLDAAERLWIGTDADGLRRLDIQDGTVQIYRHVQADEHSLSSDHVSTLFEDRGGTLWVGTWYAGASHADLASGGFDRMNAAPGNANSLANDQVVHIAGGPHNDLYFSTLDGLDHYDLGTGKMQLYHHDPANPHSLSDNRVDLVIPEPSGLWWVGTDSGLNRFDPVSGNFTPIKLAPDFPDSGFTQSVARTGDGIMWFGTRGGLIRHDPRNNTSTIYRNDPKNPNTLCDNWIWFLLKGSNDVLWLATMNGLDRFDIKTGHFTHYHHDPADPHSLSHNRVHMLMEDSKNRIWVGTAGGLNLMGTAADGTTSFQHFTSGDGSASDPIGSIIEGDNGMLWISTTSGISRFDIATGKFKHYTDKDGLVAGSYFINSSYKAPDGTLYFGGINGVSIFRPEAIRENPNAPQVAVTDFLIFNQSVLKGKMPEGVTLASALQDSSALTLPYRDSVFSFEFAALHYADPERNQYAYQLQGFDKDWVTTDAAKRFATYTNLDPGHYVFRVKASNKDGVWNNAGVHVDITITPPFWLTWWFRTATAALLLGLVYLAYRVRIRQLLRQTTALEQEVNARTREVVQQKDVVEKQKQEAERQKESVEQAHHNISVISDIGRQLTATLEIEAIMETLYQNVNELMDASVFGIGLYRPEQEIIEVPYAMERGIRFDAYVRDAREPNQMSVWCIRNKKEIFINNLEEEHQQYITNLELTSSRGDLGLLSDGSEPAAPHAMLYVPVMINDRVLGTICVHSFKTNAYQQVHLDMLRTLATYVAVAFDNAEAYKRLGLAQQRLISQEKMAALGSLVAGVAHELNTPIGNGMLTASALQERTNEMAEKMNDPKFRRSDLVAFVNLSQDAASLIMRGLQSAADLINSFKQVAVDQTSAQRRLHNLQKTSQEIIATMASKLRKLGHSITVDVPADIEIDGYPGAFGQVITNFVDNAVLHAYDGRRGGQMHLHAARIGAERVRITFSDDGAGIAPGNVKRIFDPFFTTKLGRGGSGLGLNITYNIVTSLLGGDISVKSEIGLGTTFTVELPLTAPAEGQRTGN